LPRRVPARPESPPAVDARGDALDLATVATVVDRIGRSPSDLIPVLQRLQGHYGYLPEAVVAELSRVTGISSSRIYGVITFYAQFSTTPAGRHKVCVCQGTACHVRGAHAVRRAVESELGIKAGDTSDDLAYSLETVACLGACSLAPVMTIDSRYFGRLTGSKVAAALGQMALDTEDEDDTGR
jgi:NADH:ubiquinone oxidoreductase subunit E